jgi:hypothetical protein
VLSEKYIEMPEFIVPSVNGGVQWSFWLYNESTGRGTTRIFEVATQDENVYLEQYTKDRTKFRYGDGGPIFYMSADTWHHGTCIMVRKVILHQKLIFG